MPFNLVVEKWIPVLRASGRSDWIAPWQVADRDDPPLRVASPRPDFDSALTQFLIGLLQTAFMPEDEREWRKRLKEPDVAHQLKHALEPFIPYFNLDGDGPRFMQDFELDVGRDPNPIASLLIESPGENTIKNNGDFFIKRGRIDALGPAMTAAALYTLQCNAPSGGKGHRTSLRGGGPLTTVVEGADLWSTLWLNVLPSDAWEMVPGNHEVGISAVFPWSGPTRKSDKGQTTTPQDASPLEHFWGMPRRIRIAFEKVAGPHLCDLSGRESEVLCSGFSATAYGVNYEGAFLHPLTPYTVLKEGEPPNPKKLKSDGLPYRDWPLVAVGSETALPARVVTHCATHRSDQVFPLRIWASGFAMDNMKAEAFFSVRQPLVSIRPEFGALFSALVESLVASADAARRVLLDALKLALRKSHAERKSLTGKEALEAVSRVFWFATADAFFEHVNEARRLLEEGGDEMPVRESWLSALHSEAVTLYRKHSQETAGYLGTDVKQLAEGHRLVTKATHPNASGMRKAIGLAVESPKRRKKS